MEITQIKVKDLKEEFGDLEVPLLSFINDKTEISTHLLSTLDDELVITIRRENQEYKFEQLLNSLLLHKYNNEPCDALLVEIDKTYNKLPTNSRFINYMSSFEDNYPNVKEKKIKEYKKEESVKEEVVLTNLPLPTESSAVSIEKTESAISIPKHADKKPEDKTFDITPKLKNDNSARDKIISLAYKGLTKPLDCEAKDDILGRWWDIKALENMDFGDLLVEALMKDDYPPYLSNTDKDEIEHINKIFIETKGRKPFEHN